MRKDWDFYACRVDDKPGSIFADLAIAREAPLAGSPQMGYVLVEMNAPRPDGLSSQAEFDALAAIEDKLEAELCRAPGTIYVGRSTAAGRRDFFFYTAAGDRWQDRVAAVMQSFPGYDFECGARADAEWQTYFGFLYPSPLDHHRISNRRVCVTLEKHGDPLSAEREIDHWAYFPSADARDTFIAEAGRLGFKLRDSRVRRRRASFSWRGSSAVTCRTSTTSTR